MELLMEGPERIMSDEHKSKAELLRELNALRKRICEFEQANQTYNGLVESKHNDFEEKFREFSENIPVGVYRTTPDGRIIMANSSLVQMLGFSSFQELSHRNVEKAGFAPGYPRSVFKKLVEKEGKVIGLESAWKRRDGTTLFIIENARAVRDESGKTLYYEGIVQDITERKKAEETLRESEEKWRSLAENAPDIILTVKPDGTILFLNRTVPPFTIETTVGTSVYDYVSPEHRKTMKDAFEQAVRTGKSCSYEIAGPGPDGRTSWYRSHLGPIKKDGQVVAITLIATDVTEHKQAEIELRQSENKYRMLLENLPQKIFLKDRHSVFVSCNENLARDFKIKADEIAGKTDYDFLSKELAEKYRADDERIIESGQTKDIEEKYIQDEQEIFVHTVKTPVKDEQGNVTGILGIFWDITDRRKAEQQLQESEEKFRQVVSTTTDAIMLFDVETRRFIEVNKACEELYGYSREEFLNLKQSDITAEPRKTNESIEQTLKGKLFKIPIRYHRKKDGTVFPVEISAGTFELGGRRILCGVIRDITERLKAEEHIRKLSSAVEQSIDGIALLDLDSKLLYVNEAFARMHDYTPAEMIGMPVTKLHDKEQVDVLTVGKYQVRTRGCWEGEIWHIKKDNVPFPTYMSVTLLKNDEGKPTGVLAVAKDITELKKMEQSLRESQRWQRAILDTIPDMAWLKDKESKYIAANEALCKAFGIKFEDFVGKTDLDISPKDLAERYRADDQEVIKSGKRKLIEEPWGRKQGERIWIETIKTPIYNDQGQIIGTSGIARDVTDRKKLERALIESERRYRMLFNTTPVGVGLASLDGKVLAFNNALLNMTGYSEAEIRQINLKDTYVNPHKRAELLEKLRTNNLVQNFEVQLKRKDGTTYWASLTVSKFDQAGQDVILAVSLDITEHKKAGEKIKTLITAIEQSIDGIAITDMEPKLLYVNEAFARMHDYTPDEIIGMPVAKLHNKEQEKQITGGIHQVRTRGSMEGEIEHIKKDGTSFPTYMSVTLLKDNDGRPSGMLAVARDITESKQREEELNNYGRKMARSERLASLGTLSAGLAHELNQPLTVITLLIENLLADMEAMQHPGTVMDGLREVLDEVSKVTSIARRFRNAARATSQRVYSQVDLKYVAEKTLKLFEERAQRAKITLVLRGFNKLPFVHSSEEEMGQLFFALVENAIQAADGKKNHRLVISGAVKEQHIELRFSDNCGGIEPEYLGRIFEPFFSTKLAGEATGLGLCIVENVVSRAGGKIHVESKRRKGTTFYITLPVKSGDKLPRKAR
jgi:PAS domain S-box-containing protein